MAEKETSKNAATDVMASGMKTLTDLQNAGFGSTAWMGTAWIEAMSDMGSEVAKFVADRISEDVRTQHEILHCKDVNELQKIQSKFLSDAVEQYTAETGKLVEMSNALLSAGAKSKTPESDEKTPVKGSKHSTPL